MEKELGRFIAQKRKELGYTQKDLAEKLNISFQAVSKWENGTTTPDISLLSQIAYILHTSVDALVGYNRIAQTVYEERYNREDYYWGIVPSRLCYEIMKLKPPIKPYRVLDIGCGEGKDAVFLAKNGYEVFAFDVADTGLKKAKELAQKNHVSVHFFNADINEYDPNMQFDIVFFQWCIPLSCLKPEEKANRCAKRMHIAQRYSRNQCICGKTVYCSRSRQRRGGKTAGTVVYRRTSGLLSRLAGSSKRGKNI